MKELDDFVKENLMPCGHRCAIMIVDGNNPGTAAAMWDNDLTSIDICRIVGATLVMGGSRMLGGSREPDVPGPVLAIMEALAEMLMANASRLDKLNAKGPNDA